MKIIDLGLGSPTDIGPKIALDRFNAEQRKPGGTGYSPRNGVREAREAVAEWMNRKFGIGGLDPEANVTFGDGSRVLLVSAFKPKTANSSGRALFEQGDEVVLPSRYYNGHGDALKEFGLKLLPVAMPNASEFVDGLERELKAGKRPKGVVTCFVSNPTGISCGLAEYQRLVALAQQYRFVILDDYAYGALDFRQKYVPNILSVPGALKVAVCFFTASKMFSLAGWKVGFAVGAPDTIAGITERKSIYSEGGSIPGQLGVASALLSGDDYVDWIRDVYHERAEFTTQMLRQAGMTDAVMPDGGMFGWFQVPSAYRGGTVRFTEELAERQVIVRHDKIYGGNGTHIRWCLRVSKEDTETACGAVKEVLRAG